MRSKRITTFLLLASLIIIVSASSAAGDWGWRGPTGNGHAATTENIPSAWSTDSNVVWVSEVPGRGHSSPIVFGGKIFLTTADENAATQTALCYDAKSGERLWATLCHENVALSSQHPKNTQASPSVAIGAGHAFVVFCNDDKVHVTCLDFDGKIVWQKAVGQWIPTRYQFGFGQTPIFHDGRLIVTAESETEPFLVALDPADGEEIWKIERPEATSYSTPVVANLGGKDQLMISGGRTVSSYDPKNGEGLWEVEAAWVVSCGTMVWHPKEPIVYASGGYPAKQTLAVTADGSGEVVWENGVKCYEQSMIVVDDCLYGYAEGGILYCWDALSGKQLWRERLGGNGESASPVFADGRIHITNEEGRTWVIRPSREKFDLVAENQLEEEAFASFAVVNNRIIMRVADRDGDRQELLYCIGK